MEEIESTPEFQALVVAATAQEERRMGDSVIPAEPPQWNEVRRLARELLDTSSSHLRLHIYLIQAEGNVNGFSGFHAALQTALNLLRERWDEMYPPADLEDPDDMYYERVNLMNELSEQPVFLDTIYRLPLVSVRGIGDFSTRDLDISAGALTGSSEDQARCQEGLIRGAFAESELDNLQAVSDALDALPETCKSIEAVFAEKTGQQGVLSLGHLQTRIETCRHRFREYADEFLAVASKDGAVDDSPVTTAQEVDSTLAPANATSSTLHNREMVTASFNAVLRYYEQHEPSSPVRVLTYNARNFVDKSFFEVLQAMAPDSCSDLPSMLLHLRDQPLGSLLNDCYTRFLAQPAELMNNDQGGQINASNSPSEITGNNHTIEVISSRQQVVEVLQDIEAYFIHAEPSSPIPLIVADIRKLVPKRFTDLIADFSRTLPSAVTETGE